MRKKRSFLLLILWGAVCIPTGIFLIVFADSLDLYFQYVIGTVLCIMASLSIYFSCRRNTFQNTDDRTILKNMVLLALGILVIASPRARLFVCLLWGAYSILKSASEFQWLAHSFYIKEYRIIRLILTVTEFVLGIILLLELSEALGHHITFLGISLVIQGINYLFSAARKQEFNLYHVTREADLQHADVIDEVFCALIRSDSDARVLEDLLSRYHRAEEQAPKQKTAQPPEKETNKVKSAETTPFVSLK